MLSSFNIHVFTFEKFGNARREKANTESNVETTQTLAGCRRKVNTLAVENLEQMPITQTSLPFEDYDRDDDAVELADAYEARNDPADPGSDVGEEALDCDDDEENDTFYPYVAPVDVSVFKAVELDAIALLTDTWDQK